MKMIIIMVLVGLAGCSAMEDRDECKDWCEILDECGYAITGDSCMDYCDTLQEHEPGYVDLAFDCHDQYGCGEEFNYCMQG